MLGVVTYYGVIYRGYKNWGDGNILKGYIYRKGSSMVGFHPS